MNSFKKLSLVIAAALASTMLATTAANAAPSTVLTVGGSAASTSGVTSAFAIVIPVPADNSVDLVDALKISIAGLDTGSIVSAVAANSTLTSVVSSANASVTASSGSSSISVNTGTGTTAEFYVYTKTTAVGSVSVTIGSNTSTYYVQGSAGPLNSIALSAPSSAAAGTIQTIKVSGYDVFGNAKSGATINTLVSNNGVASATALTTDTAIATIGTKEQSVTMPASGSVTVTAYANVASAIVGLSAPVGSVVGTITVRDLSAELATKTAELAAANSALSAANSAKTTLELALAAEKTARANSEATAKAAADMKDATYKLEYNALATKWNKAHPKAKVALKK